MEQKIVREIPKDAKSIIVVGQDDRPCDADCAHKEFVERVPIMYTSQIGCILYENRYRIYYDAMWSKKR